MIGSIVVLAIKKCSADASPYVRKAAALAIPKCYESVYVHLLRGTHSYPFRRLDESHLLSLIPIVIALLRDRSPLSIGAASLAFQTVCPTRLDLIHTQYRRLCRILVDVDEWGQVELIDLLLRYARSMLTRPIVTISPTATGEEAEEEVDKDLELLLTSAEPLFQSRNPAVVLAVTRLFYYLAPPSKLSKIVQPLTRLPRISPQVERVAVAYILLISYSHPVRYNIILRWALLKECRRYLHHIIQAFLSGRTISIKSNWTRLPSCKTSSRQQTCNSFCVSLSCVNTLCFLTI